MTLRLLSIGAHPADIFDQSGGVMAHHVRRGDWVGSPSAASCATPIAC